MTEATICETKHSDYDVTQKTREMTPEDKSNNKSFASSDLPEETTGVDFDASSSSLRHDDDDADGYDDFGVVDCDEEEIVYADDKNRKKNRRQSASEENDENRFGILLQQKDNEIKRLNEEIKHLRSALAENNNKFDIRTKELVEELERHAELVEELQSKNGQQQQQIVALRQQLQRKQQQLSSAVLQKPHTQQQQQYLSAASQQPQHANALKQQKISATATTNNGSSNKNIGATTMASEELISGTNVSNTNEDVCAELSAFIEKYRHTNASNQQLSSSNEGDEAFANPAFVELLGKLFTDNGATINQAGNLFNEEASNNLLAILLEASSSGDNSILNSGNNCSEYASNGYEMETVTTPKSTKLFHKLSHATIRDAVAGVRTGDAPTGEQPFYRGSAASSSSSAASAVNSNSIAASGSGGNNSRTKFSQHVNNFPVSSHATTIANLVASCAPSENVVARPSITSTPVTLPLVNGSAQKSYGAMHCAITPSSSSSNAKPLSDEEQRIVTEMQERITANVAQLGTHPLNTFTIAAQCKRLMLAYNIGQRLFAKAVMCQVVKSQGSLSELLSKPRAWHKLTDKGREAFRRIYGWLRDDVAIELLCQLSPRRVAMPGDRIDHPLPESLLDHGDSAMYEAEFAAQRLAAGSGSSVAVGSGLDESLTGLLSSAIIETDDDEKYASSHNNVILSKALASPGTNSSINSSPPNLSQAYHQHQLGFGGLSSPASSTTSTVTSKVGGAPAATSNNSNNLNTAHLSVTSSNIGSRWRHDDIPREKIIGIFEAEKAKLREQVKQCVEENLTNGDASGDSTPNSPRSGSIVGRSLIRADPTPINQDQFEKYSFLDTEDLVKQVKDYLSRHSVSQRQFGEAVLGLSQGSVSDLLARPKGWAMLTHKGREPFIRMRIFLDEHANEEKTPAALHAITTSSAVGDFEGGIEKMEDFNFGMEEEYRETPEPDVLFKTFLDRVKIEKAAIGETNNNAPLSRQSSKTPQPISNMHDHAAPLATIVSASVNSANEQAVKPSSDELCPLDTVDISRRVKEFLSKHGVSQRAFGEHVLGMTSGSVSDLLSRPKPWSALSWKGRESYTRISQFMHDEQAMNALKNNTGVISLSRVNSVVTTADRMTVRELLTTTTAGGTTPAVGKTSTASSTGCLKATPSISASATAEYITSPLPVAVFGQTNAAVSTSGGKFSKFFADHQLAMNKQQSIGTSFTVAPKRKATTSEFSAGTEYGEDSHGVIVPGKKIPRFQRTIITDAQKEALLFIFSHEQRPSAKMIDQLALRLGLSSRTVTNWFHNYRTRQKAKETKLATEAAANGLPPPPLKPNPLQVADPTTKSWYKDLSELLALNSSSNNNNNSVNNHNNNDSLFNGPDYASFLEMTTIGSGYGSDDGGDMVNGDGGLMIDSSFIHQNGYGSDYGSSGPISGCYGDSNTNSNGQNGGVEMEDEDDDSADQRNVHTPKSSSSSGSNNVAGASISSQLDKAIARMHNRLAASGPVKVIIKEET